MPTFSINNNLGALSALNRLDKSNLGLSRTLERLSSGLRINSAADDASGLAIADGLRADVAALNQAIRNANDGVSVVQVADGVLGEISSLLQRSVSLAEQAASDTSGADSEAEKTAINNEYQEILNEINRLSETIDFNGRVLFGSSGATYDIQVGASSSGTNTITLSTEALQATGSASGGLGLTGTESGGVVTTSALLTKADAATELDNIRDAIDEIAARRGDLGAKRNRLENTINVVSVQAQNLSAAESNIRDANIAREVVELTKFQVLNQTGLSALAQANASAQSVLALLR